MLIPKLSVSTPNQINNCNFKHVYPVYHWHKVNGKYIPAVGSQAVHQYQRLLAGMLRKGGYLNLDIESNSFFHKTARYIAMNDGDYKAVPYVRSFYNNFGGYKYDIKGEAYEFEPCVYLLTGNDAVEFETTFGKPIGMVKKQENYSESEIENVVKNAKFAFAVNGFRFVKNRVEKFKDKETSKPLELHTIFVQDDGRKTPRLIKIGFFPKGGKNNPLVTNNII